MFSPEGFASPEGPGGPRLLGGVRAGPIPAHMGPICAYMGPFSICGPIWAQVMRESVQHQYLIEIFPWRHIWIGIPSWRVPIVIGLGVHLEPCGAVIKVHITFIVHIRLHIGDFKGPYQTDFFLRVFVDVPGPGPFLY